MKRGSSIATGVFIVGAAFLSIGCAAGDDGKGDMTGKPGEHMSMGDKPVTRLQHPGRTGERVSCRAWMLPQARSRSNTRRFKASAGPP